MSPGCTNCYAMKFAHRLATSFKNFAGRKYAGLTEIAKNGEPVWSGIVRVSEEAILKPLSWKRSKLIFTNSMSDLFHPALAYHDIARIWAVMALADQHIFQVLTKRPDRMREWLNNPETEAQVQAEVEKIRPGAKLPAWPLKHVWIGTSVEDQKRADERIPILADTLAAVRFLSVEPLLEQVSLKKSADVRTLRRLHWVIVGGESGRRARPMHPAWARLLRDECAGLRIAYFFKQVGQWGWVNEVPAKLANKATKRISVLLPDGTKVDPGHPLADTSGAQIILSMGKKKAGKALDGKVLQDYPPTGIALLAKVREAKMKRLKNDRRAIPGRLAAKRLKAA
jgi:protein gp37